MSENIPSGRTKPILDRITVLLVIATIIALYIANGIPRAALLGNKSIIVARMTPGSEIGWPLRTSWKFEESRTYWINVTDWNLNFLICAALVAFTVLLSEVVLLARYGGRLKRISVIKRALIFLVLPLAFVLSVEALSRPQQYVIVGRIVKEETESEGLVEIHWKIDSALRGEKKHGDWVTDDSFRIICVPQEKYDQAILKLRTIESANSVLISTGPREYLKAGK